MFNVKYHGIQNFFLLMLKVFMKFHLATQENNARLETMPQYDIIA